MNTDIKQKLAKGTKSTELPKSEELTTEAQRPQRRSGKRQE